MTQSTNLAEPWLRGTLTEVPAVQRAVLHALQAAEEDLVKWCGDLTDEEMQQRPAGMAFSGVSPAAYSGQCRPVAHLCRRARTD